MRRDNLRSAGARTVQERRRLADERLKVILDNDRFSDLAVAGYLKGRGLYSPKTTLGDVVRHVQKVRRLHAKPISAPPAGTTTATTNEE